ncbi:MAG: type II secretion system F family protein [Deltaproteobacteria bacterium]|nr:type II secretion system F family protein [Deltaproteobacteria bacterium]
MDAYGEDRTGLEGLEERVAPFKRLTSEDLCDFTEGLAILVGAGLPLDYALETLVGLLERDRLKKLAEFLWEMVREGYSLSFALRQAGKGFTEAYVGMVRAGEMAGTLPQVLEQLASGLRRMRELVRHILSSLMYPAVLLLVSISAVIFILTYVLPTFINIFKDMNMPLPTPAKVLMWVGTNLEQYGYFLLGGLVAVLVGIWWALKQEPVRLAVDKVLLSVGVVGRTVVNWQTVLYTRTLGLLVKGGVPLNEACYYATAATTNLAYRRSLEGVMSELGEGSSLVTALENSPYVPHVALRLVALGEETGNPGQMLLKTAEYLEDRLKTTLNRLVSLVEPLIILFMGSIVGAIVVTMLLTILQLTQGGY